MLRDNPILYRVVLYALGLALLLVPLRWLSRSLTFFPARPDSTSLAARAKAEGLQPWLDAHGMRIGWILPAPEPSASLLIFHGNAGSAIDRADFARFLQLLNPAANLTIYILEYPGYGDRAGSPSEESFVSAAVAALQLFPPQSPPIVLGESIGTGVASLAAAKLPERIRSLILLTPFTSLVAVGQQHYPWLPVRWVLADPFDSQKALRHFPGPVVFIVADEDEVTPAPLGLELYETYAGKKLLFRVPGASHNAAVGALPSASWREALRFATSD